MAALLVAMSVMAVLMSALLPVWNHMAIREKEEELVFRGRQYARAIGLFQRKFANTPAPSIDVLVDQRYLRKKYKDPITNDDFQPIYANQQALGPGTSQVAQRPGQSATTTLTTPAPTLQSGFGSTGVGPQGGIIGVTSKSKETSIKIYNGRSRYNEWSFVYVQTAQRPGQSGPGAMPGQQTRPGQQPFGMNPANAPGAREIRGPNGERGFEVPRPGGFGPQNPGQQPFPGQQNPNGRQPGSTFTPITPGARPPGGR